MVRALVYQCRAVQLAMREIRQVNPSAQLVQTLLGVRGMLHSYDDEARGEMAKLPGGAAAVAVTSQAIRINTTRLI